MLSKLKSWIPPNKQRTASTTNYVTLDLTLEQICSFSDHFTLEHQKQVPLMNLKKLSYKVFINKISPVSIFFSCIKVFFFRSHCWMSINIFYIDIFLLRREFSKFLDYIFIFHSSAVSLSKICVIHTQKKFNFVRSSAPDISICFKIYYGE